MSFSGRFSFAVLAAAFLVAADGCAPTEQGQLDEEKEAHFVLAKSRVNAMNYSGAIEAFEESLEANPHSAQAHFQLAMLFENQESDPAAAIYHYQQFLKFNPKAENAEIIAQHIASCKQQLAADVLQLPSAPVAQQQLEKLTEQNRRLQDEVTRWQAYFAAQQAAAKTNPPSVQNYSTTPARITSPTPDDVTAATSVTTANPVPTPRRPVTPTISTPRSHKVTSGETLAGIARKQGISLTSLQAANPGVNPKKLKAGQVLNLPVP